MDDSIVVRVRDRVRLDVFLTRRLAHVSRRRIQMHIERGTVLVDGRVVRPSHLLSGGETISLPPIVERRLQDASEAIALAIVHEDEDLVVVDKPAGVLVHPVGAEFRRTLLNGLHRYLEGRGEDPSELGIVHRLDRLTSGLLVVAKTLAARRALARVVEERRMHRSYVAVVAGECSASRGTIDLWIRRDPLRPTRMQALDDAAAAEARRTIVGSHVSASGYSDAHRDVRPRRARTHWTLLRRLPGAAILGLTLDTGRTHQIRVHLQGIGLPLLGDPLYGPATEMLARPVVVAAATTLARPALHAARLEFPHPRDGKVRRFRARLPADLRTLVTTLAAD